MRVRKEVVPECPLCLEQGGYTSRSRRLEQYRDKIMQILDIAPAQ